LDGLLDGVGGAVAPVEQLVDGHLSQAAGHITLLSLRIGLYGLGTRAQVTAHERLRGLTIPAPECPVLSECGFGLNRGSN
jgi:hypothetical protein